MHIIDHYSPRSIGQGTCWICRASKRDGEVLIDFERPVDLERGDLEVCGGCISEAADKFLGGLSPRKAAALQAKLDRALDELESVRARAVAAEAALDALRSFDRLASN